MIKNNGYSVRYHCLRSAKEAIEIAGERVVNFFLLPFVNYELFDGSNSQLLEIVAPISKIFKTHMIFAHPCPHDESNNPDLSFAGIYKSYKPCTWKNKEENILDGLMEVCQGRNNLRSAYYNKVHKIYGEHNVDVLFSEQVPDVIAYGTMYVVNNNIIGHYFGSFVSALKHDPVYFSNKGRMDGKVKKFCDLGMRIAETLNCHVDIEFLLDRNYTIFVSQIRPVSTKHLERWESILLPDSIRIERSVVNDKVSETIERVHDCRNNPDYHRIEKNSWVVVNHRDLFEKGFLDYLNSSNICDVSLIIDHSGRRDSDHDQYIVFEDPNIRNVINVMSLPDQFANAEYLIESDGFSTCITTLG